MSLERVSISAKVVADSVYRGSRLTTFEVTFPRFVLAEFNTHRLFSRNSASSRAIPVWKRLIDVVEHPFIPLQFGKNKAGMQSAETISPDDARDARTNWLVGRDVAVMQAFMLAGGEEQILKDSKGDPRAVEVCQRVERLIYEYMDVRAHLCRLSVGVHKQHANRVLEPYAWHTVIVTATHWRNFYGLRASPMAQPEIWELAIAMAKAHSVSTPRVLTQGEWHLPYVFDEDRQEVSNEGLLARISSARCARVSYLTHDGKRSLDADFEMCDKLQESGHTSPFEHPATTKSKTSKSVRNLNGNFDKRWVQYRKTLPGERDFSKLCTKETLVCGMRGDEALVDFVLGLPA
jgi:thymidylate synthase ThyX